MSEIASDARSETQRKKSTNQTKKPSYLKKIDPETSKVLESLKTRANKKQFGRKVRDSEIIAVALKLVTSDHIKELQEATLSERDRLAMVHDQYQKEHGRLTLDQFIGKLMRGEVKLAQ